MLDALGRREHSRGDMGEGVATATSISAHEQGSEGDQSKNFPSLRLNFGWSLAGNVVYAASQWGILVVIARLGSPEMVGAFALALAFTAPVFMLTNLQLRAVQATDAAKAYRFSDYFGLRVLGSAVALAASIVISAQSTTNPMIWLVTAALATSKTAESISDIFHGLLQRHELMSVIGKSLAIKGPLSLLVFFAVMSITDSLAASTLGLGVTWCVVLIFYDVPMSRKVLRETAASDGQETLWPRFRHRSLITLAKLSLPLGITMLLASLNTTLPRYFIEQHLGTREVGLFAAAAYLLVAGNLVLRSAGQTLLPRLSRLYHGGAFDEYRNLLLRFAGGIWLVGAMGIALASLIGGDLLAFLYGREYGASGAVLVLITVAATIGYGASVAGYGMMAARLYAVQPVLYTLAAAVCGGVSIWLIPVWGLTGAAVALIASSSIQLLGFAVFLALTIRRGKSRLAKGS